MLFLTESKRPPARRETFAAADKTTKQKETNPLVSLSRRKGAVFDRSAFPCDRTGQVLLRGPQLGSDELTSFM